MMTTILPGNMARRIPHPQIQFVGHARNFLKIRHFPPLLHTQTPYSANMLAPQSISSSTYQTTYKHGETSKQAHKRANNRELDTARQTGELISKDFRWKKLVRLVGVKEKERATSENPRYLPCLQALDRQEWENLEVRRRDTGASGPYCVSREEDIESRRSLMVRLVSSMTKYYIS